MSQSFQTSSVQETLDLGEKLSRRLGVGDCVALVGPLGAGKTLLVRGIARGLGVADDRLVCSPSYVLVQEYAGRVPIFHVDLYRLAQPEAELAELAPEEMLAGGVVLMEWADRAADALPRPRWELTITVTGENSRSFTLRRVE